MVAAGAVLAALALPAVTQADTCVGDCGEDGAVMIDELITGVNIALGTASVDTCLAFDENDDGDVTVNELIKGVNNALEGCPPPNGGLGERTFSVRTDTVPFSPSRSMLGSSAVGGSNVASEFGPGPLVLVAGTPDGDGVASLALAQDGIVGMKAIDGRVACMKFLAEGSTGSIDCDGGPAPNLLVSQAAGQDAPPAEITVQDGAPTGPGAAVLQVMMAGAVTPPATVADCATASFGTPAEVALTTATATATKGAKTLSLDGENFSCDEWTTENGPGMLVMPVVAYEAAAGGDVANAFRFADQ